MSQLENYLKYLDEYSGMYFKAYARGIMPEEVLSDRIYSLVTNAVERNVNWYVVESVIGVGLYVSEETLYMLPVLGYKRGNVFFCEGTPFVYNREKNDFRNRNRVIVGRPILQVAIKEVNCEGGDTIG